MNAWVLKETNQLVPGDMFETYAGDIFPMGFIISVLQLSPVGDPMGEFKVTYFSPQGLVHYNYFKKYTKWRILNS